jgi:hypothetical protein
MPSKGGANPEIAKKIEEVLASFNKKEIAPHSAYTKAAKLIFEKVRAKEIAPADADQLLNQLAKDLRITDKVAFAGTAAMQ